MEARRVDYVRYRLAVNVGESIRERMDLEETVRLYMASHSIGGKPYGVNNYWDKATHQRMYYFDCWGPCAEFLIHWLPSAWLKRLMRVDVRIELEGKNINFKQLYNDAHERAGDKFTVHYFKSPLRAKRAGRDAGGEAVTIGGQGAARRVSVYARHEAGPVWEYQFLGKPLYITVNDLMTNGTADDTPFSQALVNRILDDGMKWSTARFGVTIEDMEKGMLAQSPLNDYTDPEAVLERVEQLYFTLPDEAQEAFLEQVGQIREEDAAIAAEFASLTRPEDWEEFPEAPTIGAPRPSTIIAWLEEMSREERNEVYQYLCKMQAWHVS